MVVVPAVFGYIGFVTDVSASIAVVGDGGGGWGRSQGRGWDDRGFREIWADMRGSFRGNMI